MPLRGDPLGLYPVVAAAVSGSPTTAVMMAVVVGLGRRRDCGRLQLLGASGERWQWGSGSSRASGYMENGSWTILEPPPAWVCTECGSDCGPDGGCVGVWQPDAALGMAIICVHGAFRAPEDLFCWCYCCVFL